MVKFASDSASGGDWIEFDGMRIRRGIRDKGSIQLSSDPDADVQEIPTQDEHHAVKQHFADALAEAAKIERFRELSQQPTREELSLSYRESFDGLRQFQNEWSDFLRKLIRVDVTRHGFEGRQADEVLERANRECLDEIYDAAEIAPLPISSMLTARVISGDPADAHALLLNHLSVAIDQIRDHMVTQLGKLVAIGVCGLITRYPNQVCEYYYCYRQLRVETSMPSTVTMSVPDVREEGEFFEDFRTFVSAVVSGKVDTTVCYREHHLLNVIETGLDKGMVHAPEFQRGVLECVPEWLRPSVRLIEGTLIGQYGIDRDLATKTLVNEKLLRVNYHNDPAIVLGQFVLTGWGPEEIGADLAARAAEAEAEARGSDASTQLYWPQWSAVGLLLMGMLFVALGGIATLLGLALLAAAGLAWAVIWRPETQQLELAKDPASLSVVACISAGLALVTLLGGAVPIASILGLIAVGTAITGTMGVFREFGSSGNF